MQKYWELCKCSWVVLRLKYTEKGGVLGHGLWIKIKGILLFFIFFDLQNVFILLLPQYKFFFLLYSMVTQLHMHVYILFSHIIMLHPKWLDRVPSATPQEKNTFKTWLHMCVGVREWERVRRTERNTLRWEKTCGESLTAACLQNGYKPVVCDCHFWKCGLCTPCDRIVGDVPWMLNAFTFSKY